MATSKLFFPADLTHILTKKKEKKKDEWDSFDKRKLQTKAQKQHMEPLTGCQQITTG